ncbi:MAG: RNA methyltransferase [Clostridia bacterium]|nr:RNA methyltransferase [Clostridia bacterium]
MDRKRPSLITSRANPLVTEAAKLQDKKYRREMNRFFFEGYKLFEEARAAGVSIERVYATEAAYAKYAELFAEPDFDVILLSEDAYRKISAENAPQGIFCFAKPLDNLNFYHIIDIGGSQFPAIINGEEKILICDGMRDPGNLGTVIRTANALGFDRLVLSADCADVYNPKTVRAAMGALFRLKMDITDSIPAYIAHLRKNGYDVHAAALTDDAVPLDTVPVTKQTVFVIGNEGHGLSEETVSACGGAVIIPMAEGAESLNAAICAALLMWERAKI